MRLKRQSWTLYAPEIRRSFLLSSLPLERRDGLIPTGAWREAPSAFSPTWSNAFQRKWHSNSCRTLRGLLPFSDCPSWLPRLSPCCAALRGRPTRRKCHRHWQQTGNSFADRRRYCQRTSEQTGSPCVNGIAKHSKRCSLSQEGPKQFSTRCATEFGQRSTGALGSWFPTRINRSDLL